MHQQIEVGFQTFISDGGEEFGAVRDVSPRGLVVFVENAGDFHVPFDAVHSRKVILRCSKLEPRLRKAVGPRARRRVFGVAWPARGPSVCAGLARTSLPGPKLLAPSSYPLGGDATVVINSKAEGSAPLSAFALARAIAALG